MENIKLTLDKAVGLREKIDREIHENYQILVPRNNKTNIDDIKKLFETNEPLEVQVIRLKEAIQQANLKNHPRERHSNSYYIYRLFQLKNRRDSLNRIETRKGTQAGKEVLGMLKDIHEEIDKIEQKLSKFNTLRKNEVKVQFEENLLYLLN